MLKKIFVFLPLFSFFLFLSREAVAQEATIIVINQIRGDESCCHAGDLKLIEALKNDGKLHVLPYGWALRFDALEKDDYTRSLSDFGELGLLLEVTPRLASVSGVIYKGKSDGRDWYFAKNAFLVGYTLNERKKIIDTLFERFRKKFGYYPSFTVAWMIDAWSLDYISRNYKVKLHELTKEQYETDSYTLYGGIFNAPYYPSKLHPLIPGFGQERLDLVVVRQTISDILKNYGSPKAYYTSQPNDYLESHEHLDISYFKNIIAEMLTQKSGFRLGILGFENSYSWEKYGEEYIRQLSHIAKLYDEKKLAIRKPSEYADDFRQIYHENKPFYLVSDFVLDKSNGVFWYFGENYRARIIKKDDQLILDDLRTCGGLSDPYRENPAQNDYAYWIVPYLIDGSQQYTLSPDQKRILKKKGLSQGNTLPDISTSPFGIVLGKGKADISEKGSEVEIQIDGVAKGKVIFSPRAITIDQNLNPVFNTSYLEKLSDLYSSGEKTNFTFNRHFDLQIIPEGNKLTLGFSENSTFIPLFTVVKDHDVFKLSPLPIPTTINLLSPIFQPDRSYLPVDQRQSIYYWNNREAIASRNPVRLFILPKNKLGRPAKIDKIEVKFSDKDTLVDISYPEDYSYRVTPWFIDISAKKAVQTKVTLYIDQTEVFREIPIEFITNCRIELRTCLLNPKGLMKYAQVLFDEQKVRFVQFVNKFRLD